MGLVILWLAMGIVSAIIASSKNRNGFGYFLLGLLLGPLGVIIALAMSKLPGYHETESGRLALKTAKKCPECAELVQFEAKVCRYCRHEFPQVKAVNYSAASIPERRDGLPGWAIALLICAGFLAVSYMAEYFGINLNQ